MPRGWLLGQLQIQANGLTGHLDEFWPSVADSRWIGGTQEGWERGPYWLDGLIPLAFLLRDNGLRSKARYWVDYILAHQQEDGWLGPKNDPHEGTGEAVLDPWPLFVLFKALIQWQEATEDARILPAVLRASQRIGELLREKPLQSWAKMRWADLVLSMHWLYERTGETFLLDVAALAQSQGYDWPGFFDHFTHTEKIDPKWLATLSEKDCLPLHGVNNAMGVKSAAVWARQSGDPDAAYSSLQAVKTLDRYHGQVTGMFSGDEHLAGRSPSQGTETCTVAEYLFTLEQLIALTGEPALADLLERVAYNALPAALTKDMWGRQYDQQPNQVLCSVARRDWVSNGPYSNLFSLEGNFGCCTANFHQAWPKFVSHLWMKTTSEERTGLVAIAYGPCVVSTTIAGVRVTVEETTEYPFRGDITFTIHVDVPFAFPLHLRVPAWAEGATVQIGDGPEVKTVRGEFHIVERTWQEDDQVTLRLPLMPRMEHRDNAVSFLYGPLVLALRVGTEFRQIGGTLPHADWEVHPTTSWNFGTEPNTKPLTVREFPVSRIPFSPEEPALVITAPLRGLPDWGLVNDSAAAPTSAVAANSDPVETRELIPYGSTYLRISEFPVVAPIVAKEAKGNE